MSSFKSLASHPFGLNCEAEAHMEISEARDMPMSLNYPCWCFIMIYHLCYPALLGMWK